MKIGVIPAALALAYTSLYSTADARAAIRPQIAPLQVEVSFRADSASPGWSVPIKATSGRTIYILKLVPDKDVRGRPVVVDLVLNRPGQGSEAKNLLSPKGIWHGLQAYNFAAMDLEAGMPNLEFGQERKIHLVDLGLDLKIRVLSAKVSQGPGDSGAVDDLNLHIQVDNIVK